MVAREGPYYAGLAYLSSSMRIIVLIVGSPETCREIWRLHGGMQSLGTSLLTLGKLQEYDFYTINCYVDLAVTLLMERVLWSILLMCNREFCVVAAWIFCEASSRCLTDLRICGSWDSLEEQLPFQEMRTNSWLLNTLAMVTLLSGSHLGQQRRVMKGNKLICSEQPVSHETARRDRGSTDHGRGLC